jgi:hypothetical protein
LFQATAICRFLGRKFKLAGKDEDDALRCDIAVDTIGDLRSGTYIYA